MENIIQQITLELVEKIVKKACSDQFSDIDTLAAGVFEDCSESARLIIQEVIRMRNVRFRENKEFRKQEGLVLKEKDRPRRILTKLGVIEWTRDYYYDKQQGHYVHPLDQMLDIRKYERIGNEVLAQLMNRSAEVSYMKSSNIVTGGAVSRQSVHNHIKKVEVPEKQPEERRKVKELHIYADEDHVHMQKPDKKRGKQNRMVPLVTVTEGTRAVSKRRNRTVRPMHFVDETQSPRKLWETVEGYIDKAYEIGDLEKIYIHADGGNWIQNGLEAFPQVIHVMDGYHFYKELKQVSVQFPRRNVRTLIMNALKEDDKGKADRFLQELAGEDERAMRFGTYLFGHWEEIRNLITMDIPGSCTEGQVSHVLSERFSRNPMGWGKECLGKLSKLRVYRLNGCELKSDDLKKQGKEEKYCDYANRFIKEELEGAIDWGIFEHEPLVMDGSTGTQTLLKAYGTDNGVLGSMLS